jgi:hypothetical protein
MKIIDLAFDKRICGYCATVTCSYERYLSATAGAEENLRIQRAIIKDSKAYQTLRADLRRGCILPPPVLAVSRLVLPDTLSAEVLQNTENSAPIINQLQVALEGVNANDTFIIDGLQRTNALRQTLEELDQDSPEYSSFLSRTLRVEVWLNIPFGAVAYRMLLLNAGQKPMSMRHQIEVLSMKLKDDLSSIPNIEILTSLSAQRRSRPGQFVLAKLAQAFQAWLQGSPHIDVKNTVMAQLLAESAIDTLGSSLYGDGIHDDFRALVEWFVNMDLALWDLDYRFFANETVLLGIAAAVGSAQQNKMLRPRAKTGLDSLLSSTLADPSALAVDQFYDLRQGEDVRKINVGEFSREMIYRAFREYFISDGTKTMKECWSFGAAQE